jgi:hypothetical protein
LPGDLVSAPKIDRAALVEALVAAAEADRRLVSRGYYDERDAERSLDVVLPLIADAIEAERENDAAERREDAAEDGDEYEPCDHPSTECHASAAYTAYSLAARLVCSLIGGA